MIGAIWGACSAERAARLPCDDLMPGAVRLDRAISINAPPAIVFAWLCQLRIAPYSYDLLDNTGRRSPHTRSDELTDLAVGQPFIRIFGRTYVFELASFVRGQHITLRPCAGSAMSRFGSVCNTYAVRSERGGTRLHVRVLFDGPWALGQTLALVNLVMMRKQLLVLKSLAEGDALIGSVGSSRKRSSVLLALRASAHRFCWLFARALIGSVGSSRERSSVLLALRASAHRNATTTLPLAVLSSSEAIASPARSSG